SSSEALRSIGRVRSHSSPSTRATTDFFARPGEMPCAIASAVGGASNDFFAPSGKVIWIVMRIGRYSSLAPGGLCMKPKIALVALALLAPAIAAADEPAQLDEVTVTVQKRVQNLQQVPASVGVIDGQTLEQTGSFDASQLEKYSPNIQIDNDPQAPVIGI